MAQPRDPTLDALLDLDGQVLLSIPMADIGCGSLRRAYRCHPQRPHGLDDSLTLHGQDGKRLVGVDKAHPSAGQRRGEPQDHRHRLGTVRRYDDQDAATLLADFRAAVDAVLRERGVIP